MHTNEHAADDSWSSLAQELGLGDDPAPAPTPVEAIAPHLSDLPDADDGEDTALEPGLSAEPTSEAADGEETGDDGKRRRRRRRRRRKGGPAEGGSESGEPGTGDAVDGDDAADDLPAPVETTSADLAMRDVVANWNVPSWDELIGGLYRPGN